MRICPNCGRPKTADFHDVASVFLTPKLVGPAPKGHPNRWRCRVEEVSTNPETGETLRTRLGQRLKMLDTKLVLSSRLNEEGDLNV